MKLRLEIEMMFFIYLASCFLRFLIFLTLEHHNTTKVYIDPLYMSLSLYYVLCFDKRRALIVKH